MPMATSEQSIVASTPHYAHAAGHIATDQLSGRGFPIGAPSAAFEPPLAILLGCFDAGQAPAPAGAEALRPGQRVNPKTKAVALLRGPLRRLHFYDSDDLAHIRKGEIVDFAPIVNLEPHVV